jgi:glycosyltransferase involved in cell wall biosynthesis
MNTDTALSSFCNIPQFCFSELPMISHDIGVVVIGRNEGERLIRCLKSVRLSAARIVYVDSGSSDGSISAAEELEVSVVKLDLTHPFTAGRARNEGLAALKGLDPNIRFVQFIDGDCELAEGWLDVASSFIRRQDDIAIVCGRRRERNPSASVYNKLCDLEWNTALGEAHECGGDFLVRVHAFEVVSGFRSTLIAGEEPELCLRIREKGWRIWRIDAEMTRHDAAITKFSQWWFRAVRSGYGYAEVYSLDRLSVRPIYRRQIARTVLWGGVVPLFIILAALLNLNLAITTLIYPLQVFRIALVNGPAKRLSWSYALLMTIAKFAELQGALKFCRNRFLRANVELIEYKRALDIVPPILGSKEKANRSASAAADSSNVPKTLP